MNKLERALQAVYAAIDETNPMLRGTMRLDKSPDTVLLGEGSRLDSLGLVNLIVAVETRVEQDFHETIGLADALGTLAPGGGPFRTVGALAEHVAGLLKDAP
ncbi:MAG TPA: hypothetical protein DCM05_11865 [Elusimicrobia bacterium]|nr:hypothetical protein [Elusimicrobiota bacterium]